MFIKIIAKTFLKLIHCIKILFACIDSFVAQREAKLQNAPGMLYDDFARRMGRRIAVFHPVCAAQYLFCPMHLFRYWEFEFTHRFLPNNMENVLDVSSPRLFSLAIASSNSINILMINPDPVDVNETKILIHRLHIKNINILNEGVASVRHMKDMFNCIWSISVLEHIDGNLDDSQAVRIMYDALRPQGRLILTVPVDKTYYEEFSTSQQYGTQRKISEGKYFFQRIYDWSAIRSRIIEAIGREPHIQFFGEKTPGHYRALSQYRSQEGFTRIVNDPKELINNFQEFPSWNAMSGMGVCGLSFTKE